MVVRKEKVILDPSEGSRETTALKLSQRTIILDVECQLLKETLTFKGKIDTLWKVMTQSTMVLSPALFSLWPYNILSP